MALELDRKAAQERDDTSKSGHGNAPALRRRGSPRPPDRSALPSMTRRKNKIRIPRSHVNAEWLASEHGRKYDSPKYIAEDDDEGMDELGAEGGMEGGDDEDTGQGSGGEVGIDEE